MKLILNDSRFREQSEILLKYFPNCQDECLHIEAEHCEEAGLSIEKEGDKVKITYQQDVHYYRAFGMVMARLTEEKFCYAEKAHTDRLGNMFDCSRNAVLKVSTVKKYIECMALLGMNDLLLYTEDTYEVEGHPYFGAFRGRYTQEELRELEAYAEKFGIEMVPCVQTLAHLHTYLRWPETDGMKDNQDILLVGEERTYALIEDMIRSLRHTFSGKRIHIGMDEAFALGLGNYLLKNGYQDRTSIMKKHLDKVYQICRKYEFEPMIWSDMYFMLASKDARYYNVEPDYEWKEEDKPDPGISLVYWDYYNGAEDVYRRMVNLHKKLSAQIYFAGGAWTWNGIAPNYGRALETTRKGLKVMKEFGIRNWFCTFWEDDGAETPIETGILPMVYFAEMAYKEEVTQEDLAERLQAVFSLDAETMMLLDLFDNCCAEDPKNMRSGDPSKWGLYQDPLLGIFDGQFEGKHLAEHYAELHQKLKAGKVPNAEFADLFIYYSELAGFLAKKVELGLWLRDAYLKKENSRLRELAEITIPECVEILERLHVEREKLWMTSCKPQGYEVIDIRLSGVRGRLLSAKRRVEQYLNGQIACMEELEEERVCFKKNDNGFFFHNRWEQTASACNICDI